MNSLIKVIMVLACLSCSLGHGQVITQQEKRTDLLEGLSVTLQNVNQPGGSYESVVSPFVPRVKKVEIVQAEEIDIPVETNLGAARLSDKRALQIIAAKFKPLGSLVIGDRGILKLANGGTLEKGASIRPVINGNTYEVILTDVTSQAYTLTLGTESIRKNFITTTGATQ